MPAVSVIVPNYNHHRFLEERIASIVAQTFQDYEMILLDDCSTDESQLLIERYRDHPKVSQIVFNKKNSGSPFKQWLKGIKLAQGKYIWIAESDDLAEPDFLETMIGILQKGHGLAHCRNASIDKNGEVRPEPFWADGLDDERWKKDHENDGMEEIASYLCYRCIIPNASGCVFERKLAPLNCGFQQMRYCGDWLFWIELLRNTSLGFSSRTLNYFRYHEQSTRNQKSEKEEKQKKKELIKIITHVRQIAGKKRFELIERPKYDWIQRNFHKQLEVPEGFKHRAIFYLNRWFPKLYPTYLRLRNW